jgi:hypothetical protein
MKLFNLVFLLFSCFVSQITNAQITVSGKIIDDFNGEALIGVNIRVLNTKIGASTDENGEFSLAVEKSNLKDSLEISYIGFETKRFKVRYFKKRRTITLKEDDNTLDAIVLTPDYSLEELLMEEIISHRPMNNPDKVDSIRLKQDVKTSVLLSNLDKSDKESGRFKYSKNSFIQEADSSYSLPIIQNVEKYDVFKVKGKSTKKLTSEEQISAIENMDDLVKRLTDNKIAEPLNFYENLVIIFDKSFPSPLSRNYKLHYNIELSDSLSISDDKKLYKIDFYPKNTLSPVFDGHLWVNNWNYGLEKIVAHIPHEANINFINDYKVAYEYKHFKDRPYLAQIETFASFSISSSKKAKRFRIRKRVKNAPKRRFGKGIKKMIPRKIRKMMAHKSTLPKEDVNIEEKIVGLKNNPFLKTFDRLAAMTLSGYYQTNTIDVGPYFDLFYRNEIEGTRMNIPIRTGEKLWPNASVGGYVGYGTRDKEFKYGVNLMYKLPFEQRTELKFRYKNDYKDIARNPFLEFIQENPSSQGGGNVLSILQMRRLNKYLLKEQMLSLDIVREINPFTQLLVRPKYRHIIPNKFSPFTRKGSKIDHIKNTSVLVDYRFSKDLSFDQQFFARTYFGGAKPVYHFISELGKSQLSDGSQHYYAHLNASFKKVFYLETIKFQTYFDIGHIFGQAPYPLLYNPQSLQGIAGGRYVYNLLNNYTFSATSYSNLHVNINGGGILFNKLPLIRKLKLREAASFKMFNGRLKPNRVLDAHPKEIKPFDKPYMEVGVGVSNIFKVLRIEYVRRINSAPIYDQFSRKWAVKMRLEVSF